MNEQTLNVETECQTQDSELSDLPLTLKNLPRMIILILIKAYQKTLSKAIPPDTCRFYPTCSHYTYQAVYKYGALRGGWMGAKRIARCNPFNKGGFDPVP